MTAPDFEDVWAKRRIPVERVNPEHFQYATYIKNRHPQFKIHRTLGHAHSAITNSYYQYGGNGAKSDMALYHKENDEWVAIEAWLQGEKRRPSWWEPIPSPEETARKRRHTRFMSAFVEMVACFQDPNLTYEEAQSIERELVRLGREFAPVIKRLSNDSRNAD